jgi:SAM-dependent methyltransferase
MTLRGEICYRLARARLQPPAPSAGDADTYSAWRETALAESWQRFSDVHVVGKDVLDFGCGEGGLSLYLAKHKNVRSITGVDIDDHAIERAQAALAAEKLSNVQFLLGETSGLPVADRSFDTLIAFDCMEHVMDPEAILADWFRVLRPGGRVLVEWYPFKGPWGPHMNSLVPVPWAHVLFGEKAMFEAAERIYDDPAFVARHWDLDETGQKKPNKWRGVRSFKAQGYLNELTVPQFNRMVARAGFKIDATRLFGFGAGAVGGLSQSLTRLPLLGEYLTNYALIELVRPAG